MESISFVLDSWHSVLQANCSSNGSKKIVDANSAIEPTQGTSSSADLPQISVLRAHADLGQQAVKIWDAPA
jgi:hypothetical protein